MTAMTSMTASLLKRPAPGRRAMLRAGWAALLAGAATSGRAAPAALPDPAADLCHTPPAPGPGGDGPLRSSADVQLPAVRLRRHDGATVLLPTALGDDQPVLLNFIFTSCTTICPPMAQIFAATQELLGARRTQVQMVSISIDPAHDHPARLREYAARFDAGPQWRFHTGQPADIDAVQRAFNVYRPDKMGHTPVTFVRARAARRWVRLDGFATPQQLIREAFASA